MTPRKSRTIIAVALSVTALLSVAVATTLWLQRGSVEISVTDVDVVPGAPQSDMTEVHVRLVLQNVGRSVAHFAHLTLFAYDPVNGTLFGTFTHSNVELDPGETQAFSETTTVSGQRSAVAFTVKVFPSGAPSWARPLVPDQPVTWTSW